MLHSSSASSEDGEAPFSFSSPSSSSSSSGSSAAAAVPHVETTYAFIIEGPRVLPWTSAPAVARGKLPCSTLHAALVKTQVGGASRARFPSPFLLPPHAESAAPVRSATGSTCCTPRGPTAPWRWSSIYTGSSSREASSSSLR